MQMAFLPEDLQEEIRPPAERDRSKALFRVIARLIQEKDFPDDLIEKLIYAHPKGIGEKYADRSDLDKEIARVRAKTTPKPVIRIRGGALPDIVAKRSRSSSSAMATCSSGATLLFVLAWAELKRLTLVKFRRHG